MDIVSKEVVASNGVDKVKVYGLKTGKLAVKKSAHSTRRPGLLSTMISFRDSEYGDWLPVWSWLIVHPEGTFLVDTGLSSDVNQLGYFKKLDFVSKYYFEKQMKFDISRKEEIDYQLKKVGVEPELISKIILTHLHIDHVGGMKHFPNIPILVNEIEWKTKDGAFPVLFPSGMNIQPLKLESRYESLEKCHYLTESKDLIMFHTPGHTRGHTSIALISNGNRMYLFGGDVAYSADRLINKTFSATVKNYKENIVSCKKIIDLAKKMKIVFLPTHDIGNIERLENNDEINVY